MLLSPFYHTNLNLYLGERKLKRIILLLNRKMNCNLLYSQKAF